MFTNKIIIIAGLSLLCLSFYFWILVIKVIDYIWILVIKVIDYIWILVIKVIDYITTNSKTIFGFERTINSCYI